LPNITKIVLINLLAGSVPEIRFMVARPEIYGSLKFWSVCTNRFDQQRLFCRDPIVIYSCTEIWRLQVFAIAFVF